MFVVYKYAICYRSYSLQQLVYSSVVIAYVYVNSSKM